MISQELFNYLLIAWMLLALITFLVVLRVTVPYGRHTTSSWGSTIPSKWGWFIMELPVIVIFTWLFFSGSVEKTWPLLVIFGLFMLHYFHRVFIFPLAIKSAGKRMPAVIVLLAVIFNLINGFFNGYWLGWLSPGYANDWFYDPRFLLGLIVFIIGMYLNISSDYHLISLRKGRNAGYFIPQKGMFRYVSSPNLLGEILEWIGWAILSWCMPAAAFALWTMANLIPRALDHHRWYMQKFPDYPAERNALLPSMKSRNHNW